MSKKRIIAIVTVIVLLFAAGISVGVFLYGRGETEAADGSQAQATTDGNQVADGNQTTDGTQTGESNENPTTNPEPGDETTTTTPDAENVAGAVDDETVDDENVADADVDNDNVAGDAGNAGNADVTTGTNVNEVGETTITRIEEEERLISEAFWDWWQPMEVAITPTDIGVQIPQITVKKAAITGVGGEQLIYAGQDITYVIAVTNNSETDVENIEVTDRIPQNTTFVSIDDAILLGETVGTKTTVGTENEVAGVKWVVSIPAGETVIAKFTVNVIEEVTGTILNTAIANGEESNEVKTSIIRTNKSSIVTRNNEQVETAKIGDLITYKITVENTGEVEGTTYITDTIPAGTEFVSAQEGAMVTKSVDTTVIWSVNIPAGESVTREFTVKVTSIDGEIKNIANVGGTPTNEDVIETADITVNKDITKITRKVDGVDTYLDLEDENLAVKEGDIIEYTILVTNAGSLDLTNVVLDEKLEGIILLNEEDLIIGDLPAGETVEITATYTVTYEADIKNKEDREIYNEVYVSGETVPETPDEEPEIVEDNDDETVEVEEASSWKVEKIADKTSEVKAGETIHYTITVTNTGNVKLSNIPVSDIITIKDSEGNTLETISDVKLYEEYKIDENNKDIYSKEITTIPELAVEGSKTLYASYTVKQTDVDNNVKITNIAYANEQPSEEVITTLEEPVPGMLVEKEAKQVKRDGEFIDIKDAGKVRTGEVVKYEIKVTNTGNTTLTNVVITDTLDVRINNETAEITIAGTPIKVADEMLPNSNPVIITTYYTVDENDMKNEKINNIATGTAETPVTPTTPDGTITDDDDEEIVVNPNTSMAVIKIWDDADNQDGKRKDSVTVQLKADEENYGDAVELNDSNEWKKEWNTLPKYNGENVISYTVVETKIGNEDVVENKTTYYTSTQVTEGNTVTITNTHEPEITSVSGTKTWDDADNQDGKRPESITIRLLADGEEVNSATVTSENDWSWLFENLPVYKAGKEIVYTIAEDTVADYETTISGYDVTNKHVPETTSVSGAKTWDDADNQDGKRPESITIRLLADGTEVDSATVTAAESWAWSFENLPVYNAGKQIVYTIAEDAVSEYETTVNGYNVTNKHTPETVKVEGSKIWDDADNQDGKRPTSIIIRLLADGTEVKTATVTEAENWAWTFTDLPKYKDGKEIVYTITEDAVEAYETTVNGYNVTNTHTPETVNVEGSKIWEDANNQDGKRPSSITIRVLADGTEVKSATVTATDYWSWSFANLPKYKDGKEIVYTITEDAVADYETAVSGYNVTNTHTPETVKVEGSKTWDDAENQDGKRPSSITIRLLADGTEVNSATVTAAENWAWSFTDLPKYEDGKEIVYTISEDTVAAYETTVSGYNVTNSYTPAETQVSVTKVWNDNNNKEGIRPESITVTLFADGAEAGEIDLSEANNWTYTFTELPVNKAGEEIVYTVSEPTVPEGYTSETTGDAATGYTITNTNARAVISAEKLVSVNEADVVATQSGTDVVREGAILTYIISVANHGIVDQNVLIKDEIPAGTTFVNESIKIDDTPYTEYDETDLAAGIEVLVPANTDEVTLSFNVVVTGNNETDVTSGIATVDGEQVSIVRTNAKISNYAAKPDYGNQGGPSSSTSIDHIDIGIAATADVYDSYGNLHEDVKVTLTSTQIANAVFTATQDGKSVSFTKNSGTGTSTDSNGNSQIRIEGTFPVGTVDSPVIYTVTVEASVSVKNTTTGETETIPVTLTGSMSYWDYESNNCPGLGNRTEWTTVIGGSGLDMTLGGGNSPTGTLTIQKIVSGYAFEADKTFTFTVTDEKGETKTYTATVKAGETTATVTITGLEFGTYTVTETMSDAGVDGYTVTASYKVNETEGNAVTLAAGEETYNGTVLVTNTYEQETTNAPIYNTAYVYDEDGNLLVETNEVVIYVKTTDSSAYGTQETETVSTFSLRAAYQVAYTYGIDVYEEDDNSTDVVEPVEIPTSETDEQEEIATPETKEQEEITTPESESQDDSTIEDEKTSETVQEDITENVEEQGKSDEEVVIEDVPVENEKKEESSSTTENDKSLSNTNSENTITEKSNDLSENKTETLTEIVQE